ncbi:hypothetical protein EYF80_040931 [Liparis tanakae]|uniref:Uncharacterized protein n=1 Tax=Liparis tanakae TaxID=230148 RepID=A0A4Z2G6W1_9TELE|nr:hypothetical protein EYF80_040931 [Liparis tanakae]
MKSAEVPVHLAQQRLQFAPGDAELLLGLVGPLPPRLAPWGPQLGPQRLAGRLLPPWDRKREEVVTGRRSQSEYRIHETRRRAYGERADVLPQGVERRVRVPEVHGVAPALGVGEPQQQGVEALRVSVPLSRESQRVRPALARLQARFTPASLSRCSAASGGRRLTDSMTDFSVALAASSSTPAAGSDRWRRSSSGVTVSNQEATSLRTTVRRRASSGPPD